jgi:hypothetical protein
VVHVIGGRVKGFASRRLNQNVPSADQSAA